MYMYTRVGNSLSSSNNPVSATPENTDEPLIASSSFLTLTPRLLERVVYPESLDYLRVSRSQMLRHFETHFELEHARTLLTSNGDIDEAERILPTAVLGGLNWYHQWQSGPTGRVLFGNGGSSSSSVLN